MAKAPSNPMKAPMKAAPIKSFTKVVKPMPKNYSKPKGK